MRSTAAPYTESRLTRSVANERVGFPVVEHSRLVYSISGDGGTEGNPTLLSGSGKTRGYSGDIGRALHPHILKGWPHQLLQLRVDFFISDLDTYNNCIAKFLVHAMMF